MIVLTVATTVLSYGNFCLQVIPVYFMAFSKKEDGYLENLYKNLTYLDNFQATVYFIFGAQTAELTTYFIFLPTPVNAQN